MNTLNGLPAHPLLVHFIVVLAPLTAILAILCALWPAARQRLVWLVLALAAVNLVVTPIAAEAGEWLETKVGDSEILEKHEHLGETMIYVSVALLVAAILLAVVHFRARGGKSSTVLSAIVAVLVVGVGVGSMIQVYRIGHSGAESVWGDVLTAGGSED
jgi:ABC-type branched-subunit amino acid transport system permease subunit